MKILITGAAGFIGSHTAERLAMIGYNVVGIDNFSDYYDIEYKLRNNIELRANGIQMIKIDLRSYPANLTTDFDYIIHFSAQPGISQQVSFKDYLENNFIATENLLEFASVNAGLKMFINISTSSVYGLNATGKEDTVPAPASFYGVTKLAAEQLVLQYARNGNFRACSLRLYSVYGPRERPEKLFTRLIHSIFNKESFPFYGGSNNHTRSFTYVGDIVDGVISVIGKEDICNLEAINLGSTAEYSTLDAIKCVEKIMKQSVIIDPLPARMGDQLHTRADISKAKELLGYDPKTTLEQGLEKQVNWYRAFHSASKPPVINIKKEK